MEGAIAMQNARQDGSSNIAVQITGDENAVTITCGGIVLHLQAKHARKHEPRSDLDLLRPETRLLDLLGREAEIASLEVWLDDPRPVLVRGIIGQAGSGKTRLAIELCALATSRGWRAGFLDSGDLQAFVEAQRTVEWPRDAPTLVVIDYAARRTRALNAWLQSLARRAAPARPRLRLLVLERHASPSEGWWAELSRLEGSDDSLYDLLDPFEPVLLPPIGALEQRRALLAGTMAEWCRRNGRPVVAPPAIGADPLFDRRLADPLLVAEPLYLMMAGLVAARHGLATLLSLGRLDLALELACWERDRLGRLAADRGVNDKLLLHLVACVTLCRGLERAHFRALIDEERAALPYERGVERDALVEALEAALPAQAKAGALGFEGLQPDIIGETFCLLVLATNRDLDREALIDRCRERAPARTAQQLVLTVQDFARPVVELTSSALPTRRPEARLLPGWLGEGSPALAWLDYLVAGTGDLGRLLAIADQMPEHTLLLRERAMLITQQIAEVLRPLADTAGDERRVMLAIILNNLANRFSDLGRREAALEAAEEAVRLHRGPAAARPDAFRPQLASALNNLALRLRALGRHEPALEAVEEAVRLYRELAAARPDAFRPDLARALNNLAASLGDLGRREPALEAVEKTVAIRRELAAARPDAFQHDLAVSLAVLADCLEAAEQATEALITSREAIEKLREPFLVMPSAYTHWMLPIVQRYLRRCAALNVKPDEVVLAPIMPVLTAIMEQEQETREQRGQA